jgi:hypothetical protein
MLTEVINRLCQCSLGEEVRYSDNRGGCVSLQDHTIRKEGNLEIRVTTKKK